METWDQQIGLDDGFSQVETNLKVYVYVNMLVCICMCTNMARPYMHEHVQKQVHSMHVMAVVQTMREEFSY
jgi:hypothetical protein